MTITPRINRSLGTMVIYGFAPNDLLGDLAFQDGQFGEALAAYRRIVPDVPGSGAAGLVHPDPDVNLARVAAKKLLCRAAIGAEPPSAADLKAFAAAYPGSKGSIAGRDGSLAQSVAEAIAADHLALPPQSDGRWPTFAGSQTRTRITPGPIDELACPAGLQPQFPVGVSRNRNARRSSEESLSL